MRRWEGVRMVEEQPYILSRRYLYLTRLGRHIGLRRYKVRVGSARMYPCAATRSCEITSFAPPLRPAPRVASTAKDRGMRLYAAGTYLARGCTTALRQRQAVSATSYCTAITAKAQLHHHAVPAIPDRSSEK